MKHHTYIHRSTSSTCPVRPDPRALRRDLGSPGPCRAGAVSLFLVACILAALQLLPVRLQAQPISPADGVSYPEAARRVQQRDPQAYTFSHAWLARTEELRENRRRIEEGSLRTDGMTPDQIRSLTTVTGTRYVPVLLGKYVDTGADPVAQADLQKELFDGPWPTGTMSQFYNEISYGNISLTGTVYDWVTTSHDDDYYAGTVYGLDPAFSHTGQFITEILTARDGAVDFSQFDNDGPDNIPNSGDDDGYVDFVAIVHPEIGGECAGAPTNNIWSHRWSLSGWPEGVFTTNDPAAGGGFIKVDDYTIMPALSCSGSMIEIGVFCHEFGHAFGLPDLYDTQTNSSGCTGDFSEGIGHWGLMGAGNWNSPTHPSHMSAWSKTELGWIIPGVVAFDLPNWPILSSDVTPTAFKMWTGGTPGDEYFLVEYRSGVGFDDQIHAPGILVWHVDDALSNNKNECHKWVDLECADQTGADHVLDADDLDQGQGHGGNRGDAGDPFCDGDAFTPSSVPSSVSYSGANTGVSVTNLAGCGGSTMRASLLIGETGSDVDLCMRDCGADVCTEPSPCSTFWASPEVYIDNNEDGIIDPPAEGIENKLFARVRNVGTSDASDVNVAFYFADPAMGLLFPSTASLIDNDNIPLIAPGSSEVGGVLWTIPVPPPDINHYCVGVIATNAQDGQSDEWAPNDNNLAQINIQELYAKAGDAVPMRPGSPSLVKTTTTQPWDTTLVVQVCNPFRDTTCNLQIRIGSPPNYDDAVIPADWTVHLEFTSITLRPGECRPLHVGVTDSNPVHTDFALVPLTLICNGETIAGGAILRFEIDNVRPQAPCGFSVTQRIPPEGDNNPGQDQVVVSWDDNFTDVLGFPERIDRWRIFRGDNPGFPVNSAHLLKTTCIDEVPGTSRYEHFEDTPADPADMWYKMVAYDRAGNASDTCVTRIQYAGGVKEPADVRSTAIRLTNSPNPFYGSTQIRFRLAQEGEVGLTIYSLRGRRVRSLVHATMAAGEHQVTWDGVDDSGHPVPAGLYVTLARSRGLQTGLRMLLMR
jgi:M6 family metalloprotease-like protein